MVLSVLILLALLAGCGGRSISAPTFETDGTRVRVAASFFPVYEFARIVGGDRVDVVVMVPAGTEPHDWEPSPGHIKTLNRAQLFLYSGAGMETWVNKTLASLDNKALVVVETAHGLELLAGEADADGHGHGKQDEHDDEEFDPHVWLDPTLVIHKVERIRDALSALDPDGKALYAQNAAAYVAQLKQLDQEFQAGLGSCKRQEFFTSHAAFGYLAHRYGLEQHALMGLSPEAEPRPRQLRALVEEAKEHDVAYIFFETLASDKVARVVAKEIGAQTLVLNPLEGLTDDEVRAGKTYLSVMRENLANLKVALECGN